MPKLSRKKDGRTNKKIRLFLLIKKEKDEKKLEKINRMEEIAQIIELNRQTQNIEPSGLLDPY